MTVISFSRSKSGTNPAHKPDETAVARINKQVPQLKARRDAVQMLERLTGSQDSSAAATVRLRNRLLLTAIALSGGAVFLSQSEQTVITAVIALGLSIALAFASERLVCAFRQSWQHQRFERREGLRASVQLVPQIAGLILSMIALGANIIFAPGIFLACASAGYAGWCAGAQGLRALQLRPEMEAAKAELEIADAEFEQDIIAAQSQFDDELARIRKEAGAPPDTLRTETIAAE